MPFLGSDGVAANQSIPASWNGNPALPADSISSAALQAPTWPASAASPSVASMMDSSAAGPVEINLVSSPPTSHGTTPLRASAAANILASPSKARQEATKVTISTAPPPISTSVEAIRSSGAPADAFVPSSEGEDDFGNDDTDGAGTPQRERTPSTAPIRSQQETHTSLRDQQGRTDSSSVYIELPTVTPPANMSREGSSAKKRERKQRHSSDASDFGRQASASTAVDDDAAYAAALAAQEETLVRRRPTRSARKEVSYSPVCDPEGRPLRQRKDAASASKSNAAAKQTSAKKPKTIRRRRSRAFSDDDNDNAGVDEIQEVASSAPKASKGPRRRDGSDADLTDDDVGFQGDSARKKSRTTTVVSERHLSRDEDEDEEHQILTPPVPGSPPRRSSRKSVPSPKKKELQEKQDGKAAKKGKAKHQKTFDLGDDEEDAAAPDAKPASTRGSTKRGKSPTPEADPEEEEQEEHELQEEKRLPPIATTSEVEAGIEVASETRTAAHPTNAASIAIKRVGNSNPCGSRASASPSPASASARAFFGKPLTTLLSLGAVRRPGLTRKTNIPSLLAHRGAPKPPTVQLAASKRRMQDDDYEYDAEYEALIAKNKPGSDGDGSDEDSGADETRHQGARRDDDEVEIEYD